MLQKTANRFSPGYLYTQIAPGSFGNLQSPDEREPDAHTWLSEAEHRFEPYNSFGMRDQYIERYGFVIPTRKLINGIIKHGPVLDLGCGNGYLSFLINALGGNAIAMDQAPPRLGENHYWRHRRHTFDNLADKREWLYVANLDTKLVCTTKRALLLSWPDYGSSMAYDAMQLYTGDTLIYIGEGEGGCTGNDDFHNLLNHWIRIESLPVIQHHGIHDYATVYLRK